jgi:hypothetical protein
VIPPEFTGFFTTMAAAGATIFGLIFVAISIAPETVTTPSASVDRQLRATAAYIALLNPLMISLFALIPYQWVGISVSVVSWIGILNTLTMGATLYKNWDRMDDKVRSIIFLAIGMIFYGFEAFVSIKITGPVFESYWLSILADLLIFITIFGIVRAWELVGIRHFRIRDWLADLLFRRHEEGRKPD